MPFRFDKLTQKAQEAVQQSQESAGQLGHQVLAGQLRRGERGFEVGVELQRSRHRADIEDVLAGVSDDLHVVLVHPSDGLHEFGVDVFDTLNRTEFHLRSPKRVRLEASS